MSRRAIVGLFTPFLADAGFEVRVENALDVYSDHEYMASVDLVVQCWSHGGITDEQFAGLSRTIGRGAGLAGWHRGLVDAFRTSTDYHFLTGGQFVWHPPGPIDDEVIVVPEEAGQPGARREDVRLAAGRAVGAE